MVMDDTADVEKEIELSAIEFTVMSNNYSKEVSLGFVLSLITLVKSKWGLVLELDYTFSCVLLPVCRYCLNLFQKSTPSLDVGIGPGEPTRTEFISEG